MPTCMKITGASAPIQGGGVFPQHVGWITLEAFEFGERPSFGALLKEAGLDDDAAERMAQQLGGAKKDDSSARFGDKVVVRRVVDIATPGLMNWVRLGDARQVTIDHCTQEGVVLFQLTLWDARIREYKIDNEDAIGNPLERLELTWAGFSIWTQECGADGRSQNSSPCKYNRPATLASVTEALESEEQPGSGVTALFAQSLLAASAAESVNSPLPGQGGSVAGLLIDALGQRDARAPAAQRNRRLEVADVNGKAFTLLGLRGEEGISRLFSFTLELISSDTSIGANDVVGQPIAFKIVDGDDIDSEAVSPDRLFHGRILRFWAADSRDDGSRRYRAEVVPWLWFLTKRSDCRVFQQKSVVEVIEQVFSDAGFSDFEKNRVVDVYPKLEYCVQYRESDFDFVSRLMEEAGILYFFRHEAGKHVLVLADDKSVHTLCEDGSKVVHSTGDESDKRVYSWERGYSLVAKKSLLRDYNYLTPTENLQVEQPGGVSLPDNAKLELFDYPGAYAKKSEGDKVAKARIQAEESRHDVAVGRGNVDSLEVGRKFSFDSHEDPSEKNKAYIVAAIAHSAEQRDDGQVPCVDYHSTFTCVPDKVLLRPNVVRQRPRILGPQTALVVGPQGEEIATDKYGRIKVQFHWDRKGTKDEKSSCWLRVVQPLAGKGWGALALPRIGQEVLVEFLEGDPDRPLVTGTLYNEGALPLDLPAKKNQTVFRTRSTKQGGDENFSELSFDDTKGSEKVYFHAEKDFERIVEHDDKLMVGKDGDGSRTVLIEKDSTLTINKGNRTETLTEGNDSLTIEKGDRTIAVKTGKETVTIKGDRTVKIESGKDVLEVTASDQSVKLGGKGEIEAATGYTIKVTGGKVLIDASSGIELKSASSSIKLGAAGIVIKGVQVKIEGSLETQIKAAMITANASAKLEAKGGIVMIG